MIVVGLASIGVNRFLAQSQQRVLAESIAIIERTERVGLDADLAVSLARQLAAAKTEALVRQTEGTLTDRIARIEQDIGAMRTFLDQPQENGSGAEARRLVGQMGQTVQHANQLQSNIIAARDDLSGAGARLAALIATETVLARLRITAGVWDLYARPPTTDHRPGLDRLADVDFFAYERLGELAAAVTILARLVPQVAATDSTADLSGQRQDFTKALALAQDRTVFMPSREARLTAQTELDQLETALQPGGLFALRQSGLSAGLALANQSQQLGDNLDMLLDVARNGREETRTRMQQGVASAGFQATLLTAALAGLVLVALIGAYVVGVRTRSRVVVRLGAVAERMVAVARGEPGHPMPISGHDEIGRLEKALNVLRRRADEAARLRHSLEAAVLDRTAEVVTEMEASNAARAEAEAQSRAKTHFLARMSHEIRTPLNGVIGLLDLLAADEDDPARRARLQIALTSARDLQVMTEDILAFSAGEDGQGQDQQAAFDPGALARGLAEHLEVLARAAGLHPVRRIAADLPPALMGFPTQIRQVVMNLLTNAVKYTPWGEVRLIVSCRALGEDGREIVGPSKAADADAALFEVSFAVSDTGPGMTAVETHQAFDIYGRSRVARQQGVPGVGLGLAIVRQLTDAMGGELRVSTAPGRGSSFVLVLRLRPAMQDETATAVLPQVAAAGTRVLVVDDHPVNRLVARGYLERMGCTVVEAATGAAALKAATEDDFAAILIDLDLPDMRGDEVATRVERKGARLAILTADLVRDDAATRARHGVDLMLTKPVSPRALAAILPGAAAPDAADDAAGHAAAADPDIPDRPQAAPLPDGLEPLLRDDIATLGADATAEILSAFLADLASAVPELLHTADAERRRRLAHRLKGAAANFGLQELCDVMRRLQDDDLSALTALQPESLRAQTNLINVAARLSLPLQPTSGATKQ